MGVVGKVINFVPSREVSSALPRRSSLPLWAHLIACLAVAVFLAGCSVRLLPDYDRSVIDGLTKTNEETLQLFAAVSPGVKPDGFAEREKTYNKLIGSFDALRVQAQSRPVPRPLVMQWLGLGGAEGKKSEDIERIQNPTPAVLETVVATLTRMRDDDRAGRLSPGAAQGFKSSYELSMDQALTVEKALGR